MEQKELSQRIKEIEMPEEMKWRIINYCYGKMEEKQMRKKNIFKKPMVAVASMAVCCCLLGVTALAATGKLGGFFKDITRWDGAVIGTSYEQATDEILLSVVSVSDELTIMAEMVKPNVVPYMTFDSLAIADYEIIAANGKVLIEGNETDFVKLVEGMVEMNIPISGLPGGDYKLVVRGFVGSSKADQPLVLSGAWECEFTR